MVMLAELVVGIAVDLSDLQSGMTAAMDQVNGFANAASSIAPLGAALTDAADHVASLGTAVEDASSATVDALDQAAAASDNLSSSFRDRALAAADDFSAKITDLASPVTSFASNLVNNAGSALSSFGTMLSNAAQPVVSFGQQVGDGISSAVSSLQGRLADAGGAVGSFMDRISSGASAVLSNVSQPFVDAGTTIAGFAMKASDNISQFSGSLKDRFSSMAEPLQGFGDKITSLLSPVASFGSNIGNIVTPIGGFISNIANAGSSVVSFGSNVVSASSTMMDNFFGAIQESGNSLLEFGMQALESGTRLFEFGARAVEMGQSLLEPAANNERLQNSFETLLHSTAAAHQEIQSLSEYASKTPMQTEWVDTAAEKMLAFGFSSQSVIPNITAIGDSLSGLGKLSDASLNSIVDIFGKIRAQGKLTGGDMMQLSTWGIPAWQSLSEAMGKPIPELQKMVSAGLIPADEAIKGLTTGMEKTFGGDMAKQANSFNGLISTLASNWNMAMAAFGSPLLKYAESGMSGIANALSSPAFKDFATGIGQSIANTLGNIGHFISSDVLPPLQSMWAVANGPAGYSFYRTLLLLGDAINGVLHPALQVLGTLFGGLTAPIGNAKSAGAGFTTALQTISSVIAIDIIPFLFRLTDGIQSVAIFLQHNQGVVTAFRAALLGIGGVVLAGIVAGFISWSIAAGAAALATLAAMAPVLLIGAAIGLLAAGFIALYNSSAPFRAIIADIGAVVQTLWSGLVANLMPALQHLWSVIQAQLMPAWAQLQAAIQPIMPQLEAFAAVLGGVVVAAVVIATAVIVGIVTAVAGMIPGLAQAITGIVQIFSGMVQVVSGLVAFFVDLTTGRFDKLGGDLGVIGSGIVSMFTGMWNTIAGIFSAAIGAVSGFVSGFISTVVGLFTGLYNELVGHSIVPDMVNGIIQWFAGLPGKALGALGGLVSAVSGPFLSLASQATGWIADFGNAIVGGLNNVVGNAKAAASNIAGAISSVLHFSLPDEGPLAHADQFMPDFGAVLTSGLNDQVGNIKAAATNIASAIAGASGTATIGIASSGTGSSSLAGGGARSAQTVNVVVSGQTTNNQPISVQIDGREILRAVTVQEHKIVSRRGGAR